VQELSALPNMQDVTQALSLYTERHYKRMGRLLQSTFLLDFLLQGLQVYAAEPGAADDEARPLSGAAVYTAGLSALAHAPQRSQLLLKGGGEAAEGSDAPSASPAASMPLDDKVEAILQRVECGPVGMDADAGADAEAGASDEGERGLNMDRAGDDAAAGLPGWGMAAQPSARGGTNGRIHRRPGRHDSAPGPAARAPEDEAAGAEEGVGLGVLAPHVLHRRSLDSGKPKRKRKIKRAAQAENGIGNVAVRAEPSFEAPDCVQAGRKAKNGKKRRASDGEANGSAASPGAAKSRKKRRQSTG
jgi:Utp13 specific WD40 associated domain